MDLARYLCTNLSEPIPLFRIAHDTVKLVIIVARLDKQTVYTINIVPEYIIEEPFEHDYMFKCYGGWNYLRFTDGLNGLVYSEHLSDVRLIEHQQRQRKPVEKFVEVCSVKPKFTTPPSHTQEKTDEHISVQEKDK
jgi:hypothetical protein